MGADEPRIRRLTARSNDLPKQKGTKSASAFSENLRFRRSAGRGNSRLTVQTQKRFKPKPKTTYRAITIVTALFFCSETADRDMLRLMRLKRRKSGVSAILSAAVKPARPQSYRARRHARQSQKGIFSLRAFR